jgi:hypothetical protein
MQTVMKRKVKLSDCLLVVVVEDFVFLPGIGFLIRLTISPANAKLGKRGTQKRSRFLLSLLLLSNFYTF